ncbi:unnamed protein product [Linum tenue]|uniref:Uncharacterized protein n=1 Tax=Linum tenue TaxID=586396 RepID=A0AAV0LNH7_9ROSI|nr:unnamed protein product [Linum tenue]
MQQCLSQKKSFARGAAKPGQDLHKLWQLQSNNARTWKRHLVELYQMPKSKVQHMLPAVDDDVSCLLK